VTLAEELTDF